MHGSLGGTPPAFVLVFGGRMQLADPARFAELRALYPSALLVCCSTAGEIAGAEITEDSLVATAVAFSSSQVSGATARIDSPAESLAVGTKLAGQLNSPGLRHVLVLADGGLTNGTDLARGLAAGLPAEVCVTGGLAGDGTRFQQTLVGLDEPPAPGRVVALGFSGEHFHTGYGCAGGWSPFGPERIITRAEGNRLYELDRRSALDLYKSYLGELAAGLPNTALRFPLSLATADGSPPLVRTILGIDEGTGAMTFAGDMPVGARVRFMHASYEDLLDGATAAARQLPAGVPVDLALCISCVGRRIVLGQRTEEEIEVIRDLIGPQAAVSGFYSYGELAPGGRFAACQLHNQTMTVTTFAET